MCSRALLPGGRKFCKITLKGATKKKLFEQGISVAVRPPILSKSGRKRAGIYFVKLFLVFQGQFGHTLNFLCCELSFIIKYFFPNPWKKNLSKWTNAEFLSIFCWMFSFKVAGKPRWDLATVSASLERVQREWERNMCRMRFGNFSMLETSHIQAWNKYCENPCEVFIIFICCRTSYTSVEIFDWLSW